MFDILGVARKTRIIDTVYNAVNNELVRTKTLTKNTIVQIDAAPFRQWYESHYALPIGRKKQAEKKLVRFYLLSYASGGCKHCTGCYFVIPN